LPIGQVVQAAEAGDDIKAGGGEGQGGGIRHVQLRGDVVAAEASAASSAARGSATPSIASASATCRRSLSVMAATRRF
jgi:hypothetical protein